MPHPLDEWLPNDAPWAMLDMAVLRKQCAIRDLPTAGETEDLIQRLRAYRHANPNTCAIKRCHPWRTEPVDRTWYRAAAIEAEKERFQIVRVVDKPGRKGDSLRRDFQICDSRLWPKYAGVKRKHITVSIDTALECDCPSQVGQSLFYGHCVHIIYILRFVLNCPEPYRWQRALLPSELQTIYQHSHAIRAFGPNNSETQNRFCMLCFRGYDESHETLDGVAYCKKCRRGMHSQCSYNAPRVRKPMRPHICWICYDNVEWNIERFCWNDRVLPAAPSTASAVPAQLEPAVDVIQESIQREEPEDKQPNNTPSIERRLPFFADEEDSESESSDEDDMLLDVGSLVKGIGAPAATSERPRLSLFSMSRPEGESSGIGLPKVKSRAFHTKAFLENDSQDDTNYEALAMSSPRKQSKTGEVDEQNSEDDAIGKKVNAAPSLSSSSSLFSTSSAMESTVNHLVPSSARRRRQPPRESKTKALQAQRESRPLSTSVQTDESIPLPGIPALIWQEMREQREQQQQEQERQQAALPNLSPALGHSLPALNPGGGDMEPSEVATAPNAARIPAGDHTSPRASSSAAQALASPAVTATPQHNQADATSIPAHDASVADVVSQAPQVRVTTASAIKHIGATGAQDTTSTPAGDNPASVSTPVLSGHSAPVPTHAPSGTHTNINHAKAMALAQECSRLAKKSALIRKKSEREAKRMEKKHKRELKKMTKMEKKHRRELKKITKMEKKHRQELKKITKMEKKHRRELKNTKRKSKQEVKRLEKKIESLEKEVLKALARPEVAEGAAA